MKKLFITAAVAIMSMSAMAQNVNYQVRWANHPEDAKHYTTDRLRKEFLVEKVFAPNEVNWTYTMYDRFLIGGAEPVDAPIKIEPIEPLLAKTFLENREMGIINIGGPGVVTVDGKKYDLNFQEGIYVGRSTEKNPNNITLSSKDPKNPAKFYMNSATAHTSFPTKLVTLKEAKNIKAGSLAESNDRVIHQLIINGVAGVRTCQLQMGVTELKTGSVWNTIEATPMMPPVVISWGSRNRLRPTTPNNIAMVMMP
jgi:4-deoxy-L-threo-5-hexosulose-uronate ketol-isomerase